MRFPTRSEPESDAVPKMSVGGNAVQHLTQDYLALSALTALDRVGTALTHGGVEPRYRVVAYRGDTVRAVPRRY